MSYNWVINGMSCYPQADGQTDVVFRVFFGVNTVATVNNEPYYAIVNGTADVTYTAGTPYTPYDQLTNDQVIGWVQASLGPEGIADYEARADAQIEAALNPPVVQLPLPWTA